MKKHLLFVLFVFCFLSMIGGVNATVEGVTADEKIILPDFLLSDGEVEFKLYEDIEDFKLEYLIEELAPDEENIVEKINEAIEKYTVYVKELGKLEELGEEKGKNSTEYIEQEEKANDAYEAFKVLRDDIRSQISEKPSNFDDNSAWVEIEEDKKGNFSVKIDSAVDNYYIIWARATSDTTEGCSNKDLTTEALCAEPKGEWTEGSCSNNELATKEACTASVNTWTEGSCSDATISDETACLAEKKGTWTEGSCSDESLTTEETCEASKGTWSTGPSILYNYNGYQAVTAKTVSPDTGIFEIAIYAGVGLLVAVGTVILVKRNKEKYE